MRSRSTVDCPVGCESSLLSLFQKCDTVGRSCFFQVWGAYHVKESNVCIHECGVYDQFFRWISAVGFSFDPKMMHQTIHSPLALSKIDGETANRHHSRCS